MTVPPTKESGKVVETGLGRFRKINNGSDILLDNWIYECPGCGQWSYLDADQWNGRVSVDHAADGCAGGYHETHNYSAELHIALERSS